jgi:hypothetical protein
MEIDTRAQYAFIHAQRYEMTGTMAALTSRHGTVVMERLDAENPNQLWTISPNGFIQSLAEPRMYLAPTDGCLSVRVMSEKPDMPWSIMPVGDHPMKVTLSVKGCQGKHLRSSVISYGVDLENSGMVDDASCWYLASKEQMKPRHVR